MCDTVLIIAHGKLVGEGTPEQLARSAQDSARCSLTVKGEQQQILQVLAGLGLDPTEPVQQENGLVRLTISWPAGQDRREEVFYALAQARCPILEESLTTMSLEQVFLELTGEEAAARAYEKAVAANTDPDREASAATDTAADAAAQKEE